MKLFLIVTIIFIPLLIEVVVGGSISSKVKNSANRLQSLSATPTPIQPPLLTISDIAQCYRETTLSNSGNDPDIKRNITELISAQGYVVETHKVTTKDGYILTVFRIPYSKNQNQSSTARKAVLLTHGLTGSSPNFVNQIGDKNLAMKLADAGYDVWLTNNRGTSYSKEHVNLTENDKTYWDFSWHEMGVYDFPAAVDLILDTTGNSKIFYVGHSQGATQLVVGLSELEEYNEKIEVAFLLAPPVYMTHATNTWLKPFLSLAGNSQYLLDPVVGGELDSDALNTYFLTSLGGICAVSELTCPLCGNILTLLFRYDGPQVDYPRLNVMLSKIPDSAATKSFVHYAQSMSKDTPSFRQFDYLTAEENEKRYGPGITEPPSYNLEKVTAKIVGFYGDNDNLVVPEDAIATFNNLGPSGLKGGNELIRVNWTLFQHLDFVFAKDADFYVFNYMLEVMNAQ